MTNKNLEVVDDDSCYFDVSRSANSIFINGAICPETIGPSISFIIEANMTQEFEVVYLFINSSGGSLIDGLALADVIKASRIPVYIIALGECDSSALMIAMCGHRRFVSPGTSILSHQYSAGMGFSKHADIQARIKDFKTTAALVVNHYAMCLDRTPEYIKKHLVKNVDVFLSPKEAIEHGIFDEIFYDFGQIFNFDETSGCDLNEDQAELLSQPETFTNEEHQ